MEERNTRRMNMSSRFLKIWLTAVTFGHIVGCGVKSVDSNDPKAVEIKAGNVPENPRKIFDNAPIDNSRSVTLVYPTTGVVFPPNLGRIEIHWQPGTENTLFKIHFSNASTNVNVYTRCEKPASVETGCIWETTEEAWQAIATANAGGQPLSIQIDGTDDDARGYGTSNISEASFTAEPLEGALYYWTTTAKSIMRYGFATQQREAEVAIPGSLSNGSDKCLGCHTVTAGGNRLFTSSSGGAGGMLLYDFTTKSALVNQTSDDVALVSFASFSPDGRSLVAVSSDEDGKTPADQRRSATGLLMFDTTCDSANLAGTCMARKPSIPLGGEFATHVEWSPDGKTIAFTHANKANPGPPHAPFNAGISAIENDGTQWGALKNWVPPVAGKNRYNPGFTPDSKWIAFNESSCPAGATVDATCDGYSDANATLMMTAVGGTNTFPLNRANQPGPIDAQAGVRDLTSTFPKFAPFISTLNRQAGEKVYWLTFSSTRSYGLRKPPAYTGTGQSKYMTWLWMVAVRQDATGGDPSFTAFALPFQDLSTSNHVVMWTQNYVSSQ